MIRRIFICLFVILFVAGLATFLYPQISGIVVDKQTVNRTEAVIQWLQEARNEHVDGDDVSLTESEEPYYPIEAPQHHLTLWREARRYNATLWANKQSGLQDPWSYEEPSFTLGTYGLENEAFGIIRIPTIDVELPIYLGASYEHLTYGATHMSHTSLPIGGVNTNCVIAGHRGWKGGTFFRHLENVQVGDPVEIENLWGTLHYSVIETEIIYPSEIDKLLIRDGEDRLTLFTCTKNGKQRLVVYCIRNSDEVV